MREICERLLALTILLVGAAGFGCSPPNQYQSPPDPVVKVALPRQQEVTDYFVERGTTEAVEVVQIRARVRGFLQEVLFQDGSEVTAGTELYRIEPEQYQAAVQAAEAKQEAARVELERAEIELKRQESLFERNATSEQNVVAARAARDTSKAAVAAAEADLNLAQLDLEYTVIRSPIDGRVGKTLVTKGNLVDGQEATLLTTIVSYDPIYATFNLQEKLLLQLLEEGRKEAPRSPDDVRRPIFMRREIDEDYPFQGVLDYTDLAVEESTGTYPVRAKFDNPERRILPGSFVEIRVAMSEPTLSLLIPEEATMSDQMGRFVFVVQPDQTLEKRTVTLGSKEGRLIVVRSGLQPEDRVVILGTQRAREGLRVIAEDLDLEAFLSAGTDSRSESTDAVEPADVSEAAPSGNEPAAGAVDAAVEGNE